MFQTLSFCFRIGGPPPLIVEILWFGYIVLANLITKSRCGLLTEKWAKSSFLLINVVKSVGNPAHTSVRGGVNGGVELNTAVSI